MTDYSRWQATIVDGSGNIQAGALIDFFRESDGARVALKTNRAGSSAKANPFTADSEGFAFCYAPAGRYRIVATLGAFSREWRDVPLGTAQEVDVDILSGDVTINGPIEYDTIVADITERDAITTPVGVRVLVSDIGDGRSAYYELLDDSPQTWSDPIIITTNNALTSESPDIRRNRIVNPCMQISQQNGTMGGTTDAYFAADQWYIKRSHGGTTTFERVASASPAGSPNRLRATVTAQDTSVAAGDYVAICQDLEGSRMADFLFGSANAKAGVIRIGMKGPAGTYCVSINNPSFDRSFIAEVVISGGEANTDVVKEVSFAGQTGGTWVTTDAKGWTLAVCLMAGTDYQASAGWQTNSTRNRYGTSNQTNWMGNSNSTTFEIFDVGLKMDVDGIGQYGAFEVPDLVQELRRCLRYWQLLPAWNGRWVTTTVLSIAGLFFEPMRVAPTAALITGTAAALEIGVSTRDVSGISLTATAFSGYINLTTATSTLGAFGIFDSAAGRITLSARM